MPTRRLSPASPTVPRQSDVAAVVAVVDVAVVTVSVAKVATASKAAVAVVVTESPVAVVNAVEAVAVVTVSPVAVVNAVEATVKAAVDVVKAEAEVPPDLMLMATRSLDPRDASASSRVSPVRRPTPWTNKTVPAVDVVETARTVSAEADGATRSPLLKARPRRTRTVPPLRRRREPPAVSVSLVSPSSLKKRRKLVSLLTTTLTRSPLRALVSSLTPRSLEITRRSRRRLRAAPVIRFSPRLRSTTSFHGETTTLSSLLPTLTLWVSRLLLSTRIPQRDQAVVAVVDAVAVMAVITDLVSPVRVAAVDAVVERLR